MRINLEKTIDEKYVLARKYFIEAEELRFNSRYKESIDKYLHSILINRNNVTSYIGLALSYKNIKEYDKAVKNLKKAERLKPSDVFIQKELALCNIIKGDFENGIKYLTSSIKLEPENVSIQMQLALVHEMIQEEEMALMIYQKIIETNPDYLRAYIQKGTLYMHLNDYLNSAEIFKQVIKLKPDYYRAYLAVGICFEKLGNTKGAKRFYSKYLNFSQSTINTAEVVKRINELTGNKSPRKNNLRVI